jgi:Sec7-like guanine-nucleotide exchange factor
LKFNDSPKKGIEYCVEQELFEMKAEDIAIFIHHTFGLNKFQIGQFLSQPQPLNQEILLTYTRLFIFAEVPMDKAMREYLTSFSLPKES